MNDVIAALVLGGITVGLFDYAAHRIVDRRRVLFTIVPRSRRRVIDHARKVHP